MNRFFILILVCLLISLPAAASVKADGIEVSQDQAVVVFPETVTFQLEAHSAAAIERVSLIYGTDMRSCQQGGSRQDVDFDAGEDIEVSWEWQLKRSGSIPPGARVWWQWEILAADGTSLTTERRELLVSDGSISWRSVAEQGVTVYWHLGDEAFARDVLNDILEALDQLSARIGVDPPGEVAVWLYPSAAEVRDALAISSSWAGAVAFPDHNILILSLYPGEDVWAAEVIPHEIAHLVVGAATFNCRGGRLPVWLNEGLAVYAEPGEEGRDTSRLEQALQRDSLPPLQSLANGFSAYGAGASLAYAHSGEVVAYMLDSFGPEKMDDLFAAIRRGLPIERALEEVYDLDTNGLDAGWRASLGYAAAPVASSVSAEATWTPVPTLALVAPAVQPSPTATSPLPTHTPEPVSPTATADPDTPRPTRTALAESAVEVPAASPSATPETPAPDDGSGGAFPWAAAVGGGAIVLAVIAYYILRKGE